MEAIPITKRILLVSLDNFVHGLVSGYCIANQIDFQSLSPDELQRSQFSVNEFGLVIVDNRIPNETIGKTASSKQLLYFCQVTNQSQCTLIAIVNDPDDAAERYPIGISNLVQEPLTEHLTRCLNQHFRAANPNFVERRVGDRRKRADRRQSQQQSQEESLLNLLPNSNSRKPWQVGPFTIDFNCNAAFLDGRNLQLTGKEFCLFRTLASNPERVFSAEELIARLWPHNSRANKADLYQFMHLLRKKVELDPYKPNWIVTVKGIGYQLQIDSKKSNDSPVATSSETYIDHSNFRSIHVF